MRGQIRKKIIIMKGTNSINYNNNGTKSEIKPKHCHFLKTF